MSAEEERRPVPAPRLADFALLAGSAAAAAGWFAVLLAGADGGLWLPVKGATVALLALWALTRRGAVEGAVALALALLAHAAGDVLLELSFLAGVGAFFAGHLLYIRLFWRRRFDLDDVGAVEKLAMGALALVAAGFLLFLRRRLQGELAVAVPLYAAALATMGGTAWLCRRGRPWVPLGATLFVASDALLAVQLFAGGVPAGRMLVWPLYALGQGAIAWGWLTAPPDAAAAEPTPG